jgi:opacity protein-like surface antigen
MTRFRFSAAAIAVLLSASPALAQTAIGGAETVERDVSGDLSGQVRDVGAGDQVFQDEAISTAAQSSANLRFLDSAALAIGPEARVVLDRFIYNADQTARRSVVAAVKGALRWTSGRSRSNAYQIRTPLAAIGVRGTQFDLIVENGQETVILRDGKVRVCLTGSDLCKPLNNPGDVAYITPGVIDVAQREAPSPQEFSQGCLSGTDGACRIDPVGPSIVQLASLPATPALGFTGFRIGLTGSYSKTRHDTRWGGSPNLEQSIGLGNVPRNQSGHSDTFDLSVDVGYDFRSGPVVFGIEGDLSLNPLNCDTEAFKNVNFGRVTVTTRSSIDVVAAASIRGRLGFALTDKLLAYGIGGVTLGFTNESLRVNNSLATTADLYQQNASRARIGYVVGAGAEYQLTRFISAKIEYNHFDLGSVTANIPESVRGNITGSGQFAAPRTRISGDVLKAGFNFRF